MLKICLVSNRIAIVGVPKRLPYKDKAELVGAVQESFIAYTEKTFSASACSGSRYQ
jgi:hypothetical protein